MLRCCKTALPATPQSSPLVLLRLQPHSRGILLSVLHPISFLDSHCLFPPFVLHLLCEHPNTKTNRSLSPSVSPPFKISHPLFLPLILALRFCTRSAVCAPFLFPRYIIFFSPPIFPPCCCIRHARSQLLPQCWSVAQFKLGRICLLRSS